MAVMTVAFLAAAVAGIAQGEPGLVLLTLLLLAASGFGLFNVLRGRIDLDGSRVHSRSALGWAAVADLDRLTAVDVVLVGNGQPTPDAMKWRHLLMTTGDGTITSISATAVRTEPLLREIATRIDAGTIRIEEPTGHARKMLERTRRASRR